MRKGIQMVLEELSEEQIKSIRESDKEYVEFHISIFNAGCLVQLEFSNDLNEFENVESFVLEVGDTVNCLNELNL